jgi:hypothetical protein
MATEGKPTNPEPDLGNSTVIWVDGNFSYGVVQ